MLPCPALTCQLEFTHYKVKYNRAATLLYSKLKWYTRKKRPAADRKPALSVFSPEPILSLVSVFSTAWSGLTYLQDDVSAEVICGYMRKSAVLPRLTLYSGVTAPATSPLSSWYSHRLPRLAWNNLLWCIKNVLLWTSMLETSRGCLDNFSTLTNYPTAHTQRPRYLHRLQHPHHLNPAGQEQLSVTSSSRWLTPVLFHQTWIPCQRNHYSF